MTATAGSNGGTLPRAYLRACLLLLLAEGASHGYDLLEQIEGLGGNGSDPGGLYRALRSMEQEGMVTSWWEPSTVGPARRTYALTDDGWESLRAWVAAVRRDRDSLTRYLDRFDRLAAVAADEIGGPGAS